MAAVAVSVWAMMGRLGTDAELLRTSNVAQLQRIAELELNVTRVSLQLRHAILARDPQELQGALTDIGDKRTRLQATLDAFGKAMVTDAGRRAYAPLP